MKTLKIWGVHVSMHKPCVGEGGGRYNEAENAGDMILLKMWGWGWGDGGDVNNSKTFRYSKLLSIYKSINCKSQNLFRFELGYKCMSDSNDYGITMIIT